jgi:hypothetical protein
MRRIHLKGVQYLLGVGVIGAIGLLPARASVVNWDILNQNYGNGSGEVAFNASNSYLFGTPSLAETPSAGMTSLALPAGAGTSYAGNTTIPGMTTGDADVTIEFKAALTGNTPLLLYISETNSTATSNWNHIILVNRTFSTDPKPNAVADYNARNDVNSAPAGFDGTAPHVYRLVHASGVTSLYLDNNPTPLINPVIDDAGSAGDGVNYEWGFVPDASQAASADMYYFRIASGAYAPTAVPEPASMLMLGSAGAMLLLRRRRK